MWAVKNRTPYKAAATWARDRHGVHEWIVAVKASYDISPEGNLKLAEEQIEPLLAPEYWGDPANSSLRYDSDLVGSKPLTDVVLNGTAYAPQGRPCARFTVAMAVGPQQKALEVHGDRHWERGPVGLRASALTPVARVPVVYERAFGGYEHAHPDPAKHLMDARNPVGCGLVAVEGQRLPNFRYSSGALEKAGPAGFGALASFWSPRAKFAGTYDEAWRRSTMPLLPEDWSPLCLQCAPEDQRPPNPLRGGEPVQLFNLTPGGVLRFTLPKVHLTFNTLVDGRTKEHRGRMSAVIVEPDHPRVILVWQSVLTCATDIDYLEDTIVTEKVLL
jgi:hypothetical protein